MTEDRMDLYKHTAFIYDYDNRPIARDDIPFYRTLIPSGSKVLELAAGTGRIAIELVKNGCSMTCIDLSDEMLEVFRNKVHGLPAETASRISIIKGDMRNFDFPEAFDWIIIPFRSFQWLAEPSEREACLECIKKHMQPSSRAVITFFNPIEDLLNAWGVFKNIEVYLSDLPDGTILRRFESQGRHDKEKQVIECNNVYRIFKGDALKAEYRHDFEIVYLFPGQIKAMLDKAGFEIEAMYGYYDFRPFKLEEKLEQIFILKTGGA